MWPSENWASKIYNAANVGLIVGLVVGVISTVLVVWMGKVKETYSKRELANTGLKASAADDHAATVEASNIQLRADLSTEIGKVALLQKDASDAKSAQQRVEKDLAVAQKEAADSQLALRRYVDLVAKSVSPRRIDSKKFLELLKGRPKGTVEIWYEPHDEEANTFASQLEYWLGSKGAGWGVSGVKPLPDTGVDAELRREAGHGLAIVFPSLSLSLDLTTAGGALNNAIDLSVGGWGIAGHMYSFENPTLEENHFVLVVGHHQVNLSLAEFGHPSK